MTSSTTDLNNLQGPLGQLFQDIQSQNTSNLSSDWQVNFVSAGMHITAITVAFMALKRSKEREVRHLCAPPRVRDVSFTLHRGEILGLGGLVGAGRSETLEALFGLRPHTGGEIRLNGQTFAARRPAEAIRAGIGFVPEDRRVQSIVPDFSVRENLLLGHLSARRGFGLGYGGRDKRIADLLRLLDLPQRQEEWALRILTDYLGDATRAMDLYQDFAALTIKRFTEDWEMSASEIDDALLEVEVLRARWRIAVMRG